FQAEDGIRDFHVTGSSDVALPILVQWLGEQRDRLVYHSDCVSRDIPNLPALAEHCAGVMAISISRIHAHYLIWFRREQVKTVEWAGKPEKQVDRHSGALSPRHRDRKSAV